MRHLGADRRGRLKMKLPPGATLGLAVVAWIFAFHAVYGAFKSDVALVMVVGLALLLCLALAASWGRRALEEAPPLGLPAACFAFAVGSAAWMLTPWPLGGPHPSWSYVQMPAIGSIDPSSTVLEIAKLLGLGCVFLVGVLLGGRDDRARVVLKALVYGGAAFAAVVAVLYASGIGPDAGQPRLEGSFLSANTAGTVFGALLLLAVAATSSAYRSGSGRLLDRIGLPAVAAVTLAGCLVATGSRGALTATGVALALQLIGDATLARGRTRWVLLGAMLTAVVVLAAAPLLLNERTAARFLTVQEDFGVRREMAAAHWSAFVASPYMGYGLGSFDAINRFLIDPQNFRSLWPIHAAHNVYLQWLEEAGLLGAIPMFLAVESIIVGAVSATLKRSRLRSWLHALLACDVLFLMHGFTDFALQTPSVAAFFTLVLGLQLGLAQGSQGQALPVRDTANLRLWGATGLAGATIALASAFLLALNVGGAARLDGLTLLEVSVGYNRAAERRLASERPRFYAAEAASVSALRRFPYDTSAWMRLAYIETQVSSFNREALRALENSYRLVRFDPDVGLWRVTFCLENWEQVPPALQNAARDEARLLRKLDRDKLEAAVAAVSDPAGRAAGESWLR